MKPALDFSEKLKPMKRRFILYRRKRGGVFYIEDTETRKQESLGTKNRAEALMLAAPCFAGPVEDYAAKIAPLIDPAKLATLGTRGANPRVQKIKYWLAMGKQDKADPGRVALAALLQAGYTGPALEVTHGAMVRNVLIAEQLGCLDDESLNEMRNGNAATVNRGPYRGDQLSVVQIIPRSVVPELDNVIANLELMPGRRNSKKNGKVGKRQRALAEKLLKADY